MESTLRAALAEENFDFGPLLEKARRQNRAPEPRTELDFPTRVTVDNKAHPDVYAVQIQTPDRLGLLYDLLSAFGEEDVSIALSRISTEKGAAIDTFYVADRDTRAKDHGSVADRGACKNDCRGPRWARPPSEMKANRASWARLSV